MLTEHCTDLPHTKRKRIRKDFKRGVKKTKYKGVVASARLDDTAFIRVIDNKWKIVDFKSSSTKFPFVLQSTTKKWKTCTGSPRWVLQALGVAVDGTADDRNVYFRHQLDAFLYKFPEWTAELTAPHIYLRPMQDGGYLGGFNIRAPRYPVTIRKNIEGLQLAYRVTFMRFAQELNFRFTAHHFQCSLKLFLQRFSRW